MKHSLIISLFILNLFSCYQEKEINKSNLKYLALGDSYTIGEGIDFGGSYPKQIVNKISLIDSISILSPMGVDVPCALM